MRIHLPIAPMAIALLAALALPQSGLAQAPEGVTALAFSPDGQRVVSGYKNGNVILWETVTGRRIHTWQVNKDAAADPDPFAGHPWRDAVWAVHCDAGGKNVWAFSFSGWNHDWHFPPPDGVRNHDLSVINMRTGKMRPWWRPENAPKKPLFPPRINRTVYAVIPGLIHYGTFVRTHPYIISESNAYRFPLPAVEDRDYVLAGGGQTTLDAGGPSAHVVGENRVLQDSGFLSVAAVSGDGRTAFGIRRNGKASFWDTRTGLVQRSFERPFEDVAAAAISPDGQSFVTVGNPAAGVAIRWDAANGLEIQRYPLGKFAVNDKLRLHERPSLASVAFSPDGSQLLTGTVSGPAILWDTVNGKIVRTFGRQETVAAVVRPVKQRPPEPPVWVETRVPDNKARVDVLLAKDGEVRLDGAAVKLPLEFGPIAPGQVEKKTLQVRLPDGKTITRELLLQAGWHVRLPAVFAPVAAKEAAPSEVIIQKGHSGGVTAVGFNADGTLAVTGGTDDTAIVWDVATGRQLQAIKGPGGIGAWRRAGGTGIKQSGDELARAVVAVAFRNGDREILIAGAGGGIVRADRTTGNRGAVEDVPGLRDIRAHPYPDRGSVTMTPDGSHILWAMPSAQVVIPSDLVKFGRNPNLSGWFKPKPFYAVSGDSGGGTPVAILSANGKVVVRHVSGKGSVWDITTSTQLGSIPSAGPDFPILTALSADGKEAAVAHKETLRVLDMASGREKLKLVYPKGLDNPRALVFSPDRAQLAVGFHRGTILLCDVPAGKPRHLLPLGEIRGVYTHALSVPWIALAFSPDGQRLLTGTMSAPPVLWDTQTGRPLRSFGSATEAVRVERAPGSSELVDAAQVSALAFSPDGRQLAAGLDGGGAIIWNADATGRHRKLHSVATIDMAYSADGRYLALGNQGSAAFFHPHTGLPAGAAPQVFAAQPGRPGARLVFHPDGQRVFVGAPRSDMGVAEYAWTPKSGQYSPLRESRFAGQPVGFLPDGRRLVAILGKRLVLWDTATVQPVWPANFKQDPRLTLPGDVTWATVLPGGKEIVTNQGIVDANTGLVRSNPDFFGTGTTIWAHHAASHSFLIRRVTTGPNELEIVVLDGPNARVVRVVKHPGPITAAAFRADGHVFATAGADGIVRLWDTATGDELVRLYTVASGSDWAAVTPEGLFDGSRLGREKVTFRNGAEVVPLDRFFENGYYPGLLGALLRGERPLPERLVPASHAPTVKLLANPDVLKDRLILDIAVTERDGGAKVPLLRHNGALVRITAQGQAEGKTTRYRVPIALVAGENRFDVRAATADGLLESEPALYSTRFDGELPQPELYVLAFGINRYDAGWRPDYPDLFFAAGDAEAFSAAVARRAGPLFGKVHVLPVLVNEQATHGRILNAIEQVKSRAQPQDVVLIFAACHGETVGQRFYLLPHDLREPTAGKPAAPMVTGFGMRGGAALTESQVKVQRNGLAIDELGQALVEVKALRRVLIFDTCSSGSAVSIAGRAQNPFMFRGDLERLSHAQGIYCLAAAPTGVAAKESEKLGHGVLTYSLLAALGAAKAGPWQGQPLAAAVGVRDWLHYAQQRVPVLYDDAALFGEIAVEQPVALSGTDQPDFPLFAPLTR